MQQDDLSKRSIPQADSTNTDCGQDVFVPWVLSPQPNAQLHDDGKPQVFNRYYHMFAEGELLKLTTDAAKEVGLEVGDYGVGQSRRGVNIIQTGWERSNYYIELKCWEADHRAE